MFGRTKLADKVFVLLLISQISLTACGPSQLFGPTVTPTSTRTSTPTSTFTAVPPTSTRTPTRTLTLTLTPSPTSPPPQYGHYIGRDPNNSFYHSADVAFDYSEQGISGFRLNAKEVQYTSATSYTTYTCIISQPADAIYPVMDGNFQIGTIDSGSFISGNISGGMATGSYFITSCNQETLFLWSGEFTATKK